MTCTRCTPSTFDLACVDCGVRLIQSARSAGDPKTARRQQEAHLAHIEHLAGREVRDAVVARLREGA
ncbi:hypothetical protein GCM10023144_01430 [Pigmentiphaga soli]|uniref:Uncharacterized protein n=1 Tax=Pigmentiphaga soli TaxID=1007095 RepID=A0ABP8GCP1_9BURK